MSFDVGYHQKVWFRSRVGLPNSNNPIKKIPDRRAQLFGF